ncbi:MAG: nucleotidyltransferase family protein [Candidatus Aegiribacteria sp.]
MTLIYNYPHLPASARLVVSTGLAYQLFDMKKWNEPDAVTAAACEWLLRGGNRGGYSGPDPGPGHDLTPLLARETGREKKVLMFEAMWVRMEEVARPVLKAVGRRSGSVWAFKGYDLAQSIYPFPGARPMGDLDLFVPKAEAAEVIDVFTGCGWSAGTPGRGIFSAGIVSEMKMQRLGVLAELHSHIFYFPATFPGRLPRDLFLGGRELRPGLMAFSWHNSLLMVILHMLTNSGLRPVWWVDVCLLCRKVGESSSWRDFARNGRDTLLGKAVSSVLRTASVRLGAPVPEAVMASLENSRSCGDAVLPGLRAGNRIPTLMNLKYLRGWRKVSWFYALLWMVLLRRRPISRD